MVVFRVCYNCCSHSLHSHSYPLMWELTQNDNKESGVMEPGKMPTFSKQNFQISSKRMKRWSVRHTCEAKNNLHRLCIHQFPIRGAHFLHG